MSDLLLQFIEVLKQAKDVQITNTSIIAKFHGIYINDDTARIIQIVYYPRSNSIFVFYSDPGCPPHFTRQFEYFLDTNIHEPSVSHRVHYTTPCIMFHNDEYVFAMVNKNHLCANEERGVQVTMLNGETWYFSGSEPTIVLGQVPNPPIPSK